MLVLRRRDNEGITIYTDHGPINIVLFDGGKGSASIGIDAPREFVVIRNELKDKRKEAEATT
jgi:carbon storage regulator CsrA